MAVAPRKDEVTAGSGEGTAGPDLEDAGGLGPATLDADEPGEWRRGRLAGGGDAPGNADRGSSQSRVM